jgi:hypothetical protein
MRCGFLRNTGAGAAAPSLLEGVLLARGAFDLEISPHVVPLQDPSWDDGSARVPANGSASASLLPAEGKSDEGKRQREQKSVAEPVQVQLRLSPTNSPSTHLAPFFQSDVAPSESNVRRAHLDFGLADIRCGLHGAIYVLRDVRRNRRYLDAIESPAAMR